MSGLSNYTYTTLKQAILDYTEVDSNVFTTTILDGFIMAAQNRINLDLPMDSDRAQDVTGLPKYYSMFGGATTGANTATSGAIYIAPTPNANYKYIIHYNVQPVGLGSGGDGNSNTYLSNYFPQGLLYACLTEAFMFLKGPTDMLTLYENRYKSELQKFAAMQLGRRRRDDYTDGTVRIPIESAPQ